MKIIDFHTHLMQESFPAERIIAAMDENNIEKSFILAVPDHPRYRLCGLTGTNEKILGLSQAYPDRFIPACYIEPRNVMEAQTEIRRFFDIGVRWLKMWPAHGYSPDDPLLNPVWAVVNELKIGVIFHNGSLGVGQTIPLEVNRASGFNAKFGQPFLLDATVRCFPNISFVLSHSAYPWTLEALEMAYMFPNIYIDFSCDLGFSGWNLIDKIRPPRIPWDKLLYGSDSEGDAGTSLKQWLEIAQMNGFFTPHAEQFFFNNAKKLLNRISGRN